MYAGSAYATAPYAGGAASSTAEVIDGSFAGAVLLVSAWLEVAEETGSVVLPSPQFSAVEMRYDVVRVLPTPTLVDGRPT